MLRVLLLTPLLVGVGWLVYFFYLQSPPPLPEIDPKVWWGPEKLKEKQNTSIRPFKVKFDEKMIHNLKTRIKNHRDFTPPLEGANFEYGFNSKQLDTWLKYWSEEYPFVEREKLFNKYPQFKTNIQGLDIHFLRIKPQVPGGIDVVPVLLLHGWPGSVREFYEAIPHLTTVSKDRDFALELIIPSLPGYGFSDAAVRPGLGPDQIAVVMRNLMQRLGYKKYYVQGGDWGSLIGSNIATIFPNEVLGYHANLVFVLTPKANLITLLGSVFPSLVVEDHLADRMYPLSAIYSKTLEESGYLHIQSTKPDTVGVALSDSPAGLLAYILEKFSAWTKPEYRFLPDGGLGKKFSREQLIDNLMMYWSTSSITTSMRLYAETFNKRYFGLKLDEIPTEVPTWIIEAKNELVYLPPGIIKLKYPNLVNVVTLDDGGHFLAFEMPQLFAEDVLKAVKEFRRLAALTFKTEL